MYAGETVRGRPSRHCWRAAPSLRRGAARVASRRRARGRAVARDPGRPPRPDEWARAAGSRRAVLASSTAAATRGRRWSQSTAARGAVFPPRRARKRWLAPLRRSCSRRARWSGVPGRGRLTGGRAATCARSTTSRCTWTARDGRPARPLRRGKSTLARLLAGLEPADRARCCSTAGRSGGGRRAARRAASGGSGRVPGPGSALDPASRSGRSSPNRSSSTGCAGGSGRGGRRAARGSRPPGDPAFLAGRPEGCPEARSSAWRSPAPWPASRKC